MSAVAAARTRGKLQPHRRDAVPPVIGRALALAIALTVLLAGPASAHATLLAASPGDGSVVAQSPTEVRLHFSESVGLSAGSIKLLDPGGNRVDTPAAAGTVDDGTTVVQALPAGLGSGTYTVLWRVLSEDTHSVFGATTFSVGQAGGGVAAGAAAAAAAGGRAAEIALDISRWLLYVGLCLLLGVTAFVVVVWPAGAADRWIRRLIWTGWAVTVAASLVGLFAQGPYVAGAGLLSAFDPELVAGTLATRYGLAAVLRLVVLAVAAGLLRRPARSGGAPAAALWAGVGLGLAATVSLVGHAGAGSMVWVALPADALHLAAMAGWLGGLVALLGVVLRRRPQDAPALLPRWSRAAAVLVAVLVATGAFAAWQQVREAGALLGTDYGRLLLLKLGLVAAMLGCAGMARIVVQRRFAVRTSPPVPATLQPAGDGRAPGPVGASPARPVQAGPAGPGPAGVRVIRRFVLAEAVLAVAVLAVTTVLVGQAPAKDTYFPVVDQTGPVGSGLSAHLIVDPARSGLNTLRVEYSDPAGQPVEVIRAAARWTSADGAYVVPTELARGGPGRYTAAGTALPAAGRWQLALTTQTSDINSTTTLFVVTIR